MWPVAIITFYEGVRSRVLYGIFIFSLFIMFLSVIFASFFMQEIGKVAVDFNLSSISFAGLLISLSLSVGLISKDLDKKTIYFVLSKPISRAEYIFGKYIGLIFVIFFSYIILGILTCIPLLFLQSEYQLYFDTFSWLSYLQAIYFDFLKLVVFNSVIIFFSTVTSSSFITMLFSVSIYIAGQTINEVVNFISVNMVGLEMSATLKMTVQTLKYAIPNFAVFDFKVISAHGLLISVEEFFIFSGYGVGYALITLLLAAVIFQRKEFL